MLSYGDIERLIAQKRCEIKKEKIVLGLSAPADAFDLQDLENKENEPANNKDGGSKARVKKTVRIVSPGSQDVSKKQEETELPADLERYIRRYLGLPVMLKAGEYSPNNPLLRGERGAGGDVLLGLGEYERRRNTLRKLRQQQYREFLDQQAKKKQEAKEQAEKERREREEKERLREEERERIRKELEQENAEAEKRRHLLEQERTREGKQGKDERRASVCYVPESSNPNSNSYKSKVDTGVQVGVTRPLSVAVQTDESDMYRLSPSPTKHQIIQAERELSPRTVLDHDKTAYHDDRPTHHDNKTYDHDGTQTHHDNKDIRHDNKPYDHDNRDNRYGHKTYDHDYKPYEHDNKDNRYGHKSYDHDNKPYDHDNKPHDHDNRDNRYGHNPYDHDNKPHDHDNNDNRYGHKSCDHDNKPHDHDNKDNRYGHQSYDHDNKNHDHDNKDNRYGHKSCDHDNKPHDHDNKDNRYGHQSYDHDNKNHDHDNKDNRYGHKSYDHDNKPYDHDNRDVYHDERPIQPAAWAKGDWEEKEKKSARRRSYGDFDDRSSRATKCTRSRLLSDLQHTYMPSIFDAEAIHLRNLQAEKEAAERREMYQRELRNQIQEQRRLKDERSAREKMLEAAEMRRLEEQLRMLRGAQERERGKQRDTSDKMRESSIEFERKRTTLQKEIDDEQKRLRTQRKPLTSQSDTNLKLPPFYKTEKRLPFSTNIAENSIFNPNYDVDSYLRRNLNPKIGSFATKFAIPDNYERNVVVEKALVHDMPRDRRIDRNKPKYEPTFLRHLDEIQDETPIPVLRHSPKASNYTDVDDNISSGMKQVEDKWKVPAVQKNILKNIPKEDGKNISILTQLGSIRRQLQLEQLRLDNLKSKSD